MLRRRIYTSRMETYLVVSELLISRPELLQGSKEGLRLNGIGLKLEGRFAAGFLSN